MTFKSTCIAAAALGFIALSSMPLAQAHEEGWHRGGFGFLHGVTLTDEQKAKAQQIEAAGWQQAKPLIEQLQVVHKQLANQLLGAGTVTAEQLQPLVQQQEQLRDKLDAQRLSQALQLRALLSPQQLAQAASVQGKLTQLHEQERALRSGGGPDAAQPE